MVHAPQNDPTINRYTPIDNDGASTDTTPVGQSNKIPANDPVDQQAPTKTAPADRTQATRRVGLFGRIAKGAMIAGMVIATAIGGFFVKTALDNQPDKPIAPIEAPIQVAPNQLPDGTGPPPANQNNPAPDGPVRSPTLPNGPSQSTDTVPLTLSPFEIRIPGNDGLQRTP